MKKQVIAVLSVSILFLGCANRQAHTISEYQPGDAKKSCNALYMEANNLKNDMNRKWAEKNNQTGANVALGVAGAFLLVPWFFMDLSGAEKTEYESYKRRHDYLKVLMADKECTAELTTIEKEEKEAKEKLEKEKEETKI